MGITTDDRKKRWALPEGYIPEESTGPEPEMESHETICILNPGEEDATVDVTVFFTDREPAGPFEKTIPAKRTKHFRFNEFEDPEKIPKGTPFASVLESDRPVVCQHTRLDSRQAENALLSTIAYPGDS
ncbi:sensory rhodopsin transducer [Halobacteria archaeon AArc-curdl1]|uniref:Sensory rhodopsin transducer n=1 Tax=Natronosalvus hydrolyticus TaxID=2979988 RepID=A0AAP2Z8W6_9EURY|nr:sensory rhodopsin transducer [Halobacteria archaeon AArc-curdl1]